MRRCELIEFRRAGLFEIQRHDRGARAAGVEDLVVHRFESLHVATVQNDASAVRRRSLRERATDAVARSRDENDAIAQRVRRR